MLPRIDDGVVHAPRHVRLMCRVTTVNRQRNTGHEGGRVFKRHRTTTLDMRPGLRPEPVFAGGHAGGDRICKRIIMNEFMSNPNEPVDTSCLDLTAVL